MFAKVYSCFEIQLYMYTFYVYYYDKNRFLIMVMRAY